jgi:translocation and assembly module TamB
MDESDALSYLVFGRPMNKLSSSEGNSLYGAALSAGLSAGGFAAKKIGAAFGVEDIEIEKGDAPEQATLFIGKYLSPRLYINYGIGLFEPVSTIRLRYDLTRRLQVQTEYGLESGGDVLYKIER